MATKKSIKSRKQLNKAKKLEATSPLSVSKGVHYTSATLYLRKSS